MTDILDELSKIKDAEKRRDRLIFDAKRKAERLINSANNDIAILNLEAEKEINGYRIKTTKTYKKTSELMLSKLKSDYEEKLSVIKSFEVPNTAIKCEAEILEIIKNYGNPVVEKTE